jgi:hypothetical protein
MNRVSVETNKEGEITMSTNAYAMATTAKEIDDAYQDFHRMLQIGQRENAIRQALGLLKQDPTRLWNYIRAYTTKEINYRDTSSMLVVNALWNNWKEENDFSFVVHAVLVLANLPKESSALDFYNRSVKPH